MLVIRQHQQHNLSALDRPLYLTLCPSTSSQMESMVVLVPLKQGKSQTHDTSIATFFFKYSSMYLKLSAFVYIGYFVFLQFLCFDILISNSYGAFIAASSLLHGADL